MQAELPPFGGKWRRTLPSLEFDTSGVMSMVGRLLRTRRPDITDQETKLEKCLKTRDLVSLGVGSCVGTGMYLVAGMVARNVAGPAVILSFTIAALASLFSGVCYAEFGVRVPNTSGSAYMYSYVTVGEFVAFVIGWNMILEYLIGTAAGAAAISACLDALYNGAIRTWSRSVLGTFVGHIPDILAAFITLLMTILLAAGVKKSLSFNNVLNALNFFVFALIVALAMLHFDLDNWTENGGFAPFGAAGVLNGAATCFYAFIGFDIIATAGEEAENPQKSIPTAIVSSMAIALGAYILSSITLTLTVPYHLIDPESSLVEMFAYIGNSRAKTIAVVGALAGLVVSMFGSMFPMPRVVYAMAKDGLLFSGLARVSPITNTPIRATFLFGGLTALVALVMSLEVLVEMMSIGTLMAYTLVSTCVLLLRYQPTKTNLVDLLPQSIRSACATPCREVAPEILPPTSHVASSAPVSAPFRPPMSATTTTTASTATSEQRFDSPFQSRGPQESQQFSNVIVAKRVGRVESSDSSESEPDPNAWSRQASKDEDYLVPGQGPYHYGSVPYQHGGSSGRRNGLLDQFDKMTTYLFPYGWKIATPATEETGMYVVKLVGVYFVSVLVFDILLAWHLQATESNAFAMFVLLGSGAANVAIVAIISRQPQIRCNLKFKAPGVPFVPCLAIIINIYLILRLSILTLVRFTIWMIIGMFVYFGYGIKNSVLEQRDGEGNFNTEEPSTTNFDSHLTPNYRPTNGQTVFGGQRPPPHVPRPSNNNNNSSSIPTTNVTTNPFLSSECPDLELTIPASRYTAIAMQPTKTQNPFLSNETSTAPPPKPPPPTRAYSKPDESVVAPAGGRRQSSRKKPPPVPPRPSLDQRPQPLQRQAAHHQQMSLDRPNWESFE